MIDTTWPCCGRLRSTAWSCLSELEHDDGSVQTRIRYGDETYWAEYGFEPRERCADCDVRLGAYHHVICDKEQCSRCMGQMTSCLSWGCGN
jgi:hypothetical protein